MKTQIFLVDLENVQPDVLPALALEDVRIYIFVGPHQAKLPFGMVEAVQKLGDKADYIRVAQQGSNALDMHIAFHLGRLRTEMPQAFFHIISRDRDYEPLLLHMNASIKCAARWPDFTQIPLLQRFQARTAPEQTLAAIRWLAERRQSRPATLKTLRNTLHKQVFAERLSDEELGEVISLMQKRKVVMVEGQKVRYQTELEATHG